MINYTDKDIIAEVEAIVWNPDLTPIERLHRIQGLLYQHEQNMDARSTEEEYFGDFAPEEQLEKFYRG